MAAGRVGARRCSERHGLLAIVLMGVLLGSWTLSADAARATAGSDWLPLTGGDIRVSCTFKDSCRNKYHAGGAIDFDVPVGRRVYASGAGRIRHAGRTGCGICGIWIVVAHGSHSSRYLHLSRAAVRAGNSVKAGQLIGYSGNSGGVPAHLHYDELTDPMNGRGKRDPGPLKACHGNSIRTYANWPRLTGSVLRNDGYGCGDVTNNPRGNYEAAGAPEPGKVSVRGWTFDPNAKTSPVTIHVYVGGKAGQKGAEGRSIGKANKSRADVARAFKGVGNNHGFSTSFETKKRGRQLVCAYAINLGPGSNKLLGCKTVSIGDPDPRGHFDSATSPAAGKLSVRGWAFDPSAKTSPVTIHLYVGGQAGQKGAEGHNLGAAIAHRPDVHRAFAGVGAHHGFAVTVTTRKGGLQPVCAYAIDIGVGTNKLLGCKTVRIAGATSAPVPTSPPPAPSPPPVPISNRLSNDQRLLASKNQYLRSSDGRYRFVMQQDSNLVLYGPSGRALWASNTVGRGAHHLRMQGDGNLVIYNASNKPIWASGTPRHYSAHLVVQNDGNVVIYNSGKPIWATGTAGRR